MRSSLKAALTWGFVGVGIAMLFFLFFMLVNRLAPSPFLNELRGFGQDVVLFVWPASFWLMATEGAGLLATIEVVAIAVGANFVVYFLVGLVLTTLWKSITAHGKL